ncbi:MAG: hypothetical protein HLX51_00565 [Micrococcaceae bacterium]|nr:hypothetical protein [Micrococcaceae bacterium]
MSSEFTNTHLPPEHVINAVQQAMNWNGDSARNALLALRRESRLTDLDQVEALPVGTVVKDFNGQIMHRHDDNWWEVAGDEASWNSTYVLLPAHVLAWGKTRSSESDDTAA